MGAEHQARRRGVRIIWSAPAKADLAAIHEFYRDMSPDYAFTVTALAVRAARLLAERPKLGPAIGDGDYRKWSVSKTNHILIYRIDGRTLRISRVFHAAQDWQNML